VVIDALITTRILIQFIGQIFAVMLLRKRAPEMRRPFRIWLYPIPPLIALVGWVFIFATTAWHIILFGLITLALGILMFFIWSWHSERWPFASL
jgi:amino acid transporter